MPVCSYFLKGICNNSNCPYSHVYVSRKAEVCPDFLKGYCPMGEKCKKKHTLVCPDFSRTGVCPKGSQCKLRHPQRKHRTRQLDTTDDAEGGSSPSKWRQRGAEPLRREDDLETLGPASPEQGIRIQNDPDVPGTSRLRKLPSFISLQLSPTSPSEEESKAGREKTGEETGKPLQIKPRL
uniref:C3H1-type domain-containing protein n=1 Tax=Sphenodon punctatus TaxID=8508 RepID=A0A8D0GMU2_SPHPU